MELRVVRVALATQFNMDPFSECTKALRLMQVFSETQLEDANHYGTASGIPISSFLNPLSSINPNDQLLYDAVVVALGVARNLEPIAWSRGLDDADELERFLLQAQIDGLPDFILGYVLGVGSYNPSPLGNYQASAANQLPGSLPTLVQAVEASMLNESGLAHPDSPASVTNNAISDGERDFIMMNGTDSEVTDSERGSPPWDLGDWIHNKNQVMNSAGPGWDQAPVAMGFNQAPMAD